MSLDDWILALHLLSAFALVGAVTIFSILIAALWRCDSPSQVVALMRTAQVGNAMVIAGTLGTVVFGVWLAIALDAYSIWDGWVIAALVLWAASAEIGRRAGAAYDASGKDAQALVAAGTTSSPELAATYGASRAFAFHVASTALILVVLLDMIWKPGA